MYAKVFSQIYDGTLCTCGKWQALVTFQQFLVLADKNGIVDMTVSAIARRTTIPIEIIQEGIDELLKADPESRTPAEEGRRIIPLSNERNWGWLVVNYKHYRDLRNEEERAEYHRNYYHDVRKAKLKNVEKVEIQTTQQFSNDYTYTDTDTDTKKHISTSVDIGETQKKINGVPYKEIESLYHECLPMLPQIYKWNELRKKRVKALWTSELEEIKHWRNYFNDIARSKFLTGRVQSKDGRTWKADFDFIINETNFIKIAEGKYSDQKI